MIAESESTELSRTGFLLTIIRTNSVTPLFFPRSAHLIASPLVTPVHSGGFFGGVQ